jgi:hypothetical protein
VKKGGRLYTREREFDDLLKYLSHQEEILNHFFNIAFAIACDEVVSRLVCGPLGISDSGPFESLGSEVQSLYNWGKSENVTQQDSFFITDESLVGVELKLASTSSPEQIAKYAALLTWEEKKRGPRGNLGLLFIVPERAMASHWSKVGLDGPSIDNEYFAELKRAKLRGRILELFEKESEHVIDVLERLRLAVVSWTWLRDEIIKIENELDCSNRGDQTLKRLLVGLRTQIEAHKNTGITQAHAS